MNSPSGITVAAVKKAIVGLSDEGKRELLKVIESAPIWTPLPGPQLAAYLSRADIIGYGGAAGGGKSDLALGKALTQHRNIIIFRREATQLTGIIDRLTEILGGRRGYNGSEKIWRNPLPGVQVEFGSAPNLGDECRFQGRPHDLLVFDEAANFLESQVRFLMGWNRTTVVGQRSQTLMTFNPPSPEGRWIIQFFAPWLDPVHPNPALPGELRYAASIPLPNGSSKDVWLPNGDRFILDGEEPRYDFDEETTDPISIITPRSRVFIPSNIKDNPFLLGTGYLAQLQALPEPLRSQMLLGDFQAGMVDDAYQLIPTAWVEAAMARWADRSPKGTMDSIGVDVARGGRDESVIARRHGNWFDAPLAYPGRETPDGPGLAGIIVAAARDGAPIHVDIIGVGGSPYDFLLKANQHAVAVNVAGASQLTDISHLLGFFNIRSELWWKFREALDPAADTGIALPPHPKLKADLCAPRWRVMPGSPVIQVEATESITSRIGRSPDYASAYLLAWINTPKREINPLLDDWAHSDWRLM